MCTQKMQEEGLTYDDLNGEEVPQNNMKYISIVADDEDDSTVRIDGAINMKIETMNGDVMIQINENEDLELNIDWHAGWTIDNSFSIPEGVEYEKIYGILKVYWRCDNIKKVKWEVYHEPSMFL